MIPEMMFCVHIKPGYGSRDDVVGSHKIGFSFQR